jgi:hypothetical protein
MVEMDSCSVTADHHTAGKKFLKIRRSFNKLLPPLSIDALIFPHNFSQYTV